MQSRTRKAVFMLSLSTALSFGAAAQSIDEGIKMVNYERNTTAQQMLQPLAGGTPVANYYFGLTQLNQEQMDAALATFNKFPEDAANKAGIARLAFMKKDAANGNRLVAEIIDKAKKKDWQSYVWAADAINYGGGDAQTAINYYEEAIKRGGDNVAVRIGLGDAYLKVNGGGGKAMDNYEKAVAMDAKNSLGYSRIGKLWYDARNFQDALANYEKAKDADPNNPLPYRDLANAYFNVGKYDLAKQNIEKYYELSDKTCDDRISYANILFLAKDYNKAISQMQEVVGTCGERPYMYRVLGWSQYETKDYANSLQNMRTFFSKETNPAKIVPRDYKYMGLGFAAQKMADSADFYLTKALTSDTSSNKKALYTELGDAYKTMTNYPKAAQYYKMALDAAATSASALDYYNYGFYSYVSRNYSEASKAFEDMETKFPDQPTASLWRAKVAAAVDSEGNTGAAVPLFQKWLSIPETEAFKRRPIDQKFAYEYITLAAYRKNDKAAMKENIEKLKAVDPNNALAKQLEGILNGKPAAAPKPSGSAKPGASSKAQR